MSLIEQANNVGELYFARRAESAMIYVESMQAIALQLCDMLEKLSGLGAVDEVRQTIGRHWDACQESVRGSERWRQLENAKTQRDVA